MAPENLFFGVSLFGKSSIVSVVSDSYYELLKEGAPSFYSEFQYIPFHSSKKLTELNEELPFRLVREEDQSRISKIDISCLSGAEAEHLKAHRKILEIYSQNQLAPVPPWTHISNDSLLAEELKRCISVLEKSAVLARHELGEIESSKVIRPTHALHLGEIDPVFALEQAQWIRANIPIMQKANGSGKFFQNYVSYGFWHDSQVPLIRQFVDLVRSKKESFEKSYNKQMHIDYVYLSFVENANQQTCLWHKDGYWWDGQFHLTILGNSQILVRDGGLTLHISSENGTVWYLNGSEYYHKISQSYSGPRFELLAPCNLRRESAERKFRATVDAPERWIDGRHPAIIEEIEIAVSHVKRAISKNQASNMSVAEWPVYGEDLESAKK